MNKLWTLIWTTMVLSCEVYAGGTIEASKGSQGSASCTTCNSSASANAAGVRRHLRYGIEHFSGNLRLWDNATQYQPEYGPWTSLELSLTPGAQTPGTLNGGWNSSATGYVTTKTETLMPRGEARVYLRGGGYETYIANEGASCSSASGVRCSYAPDGISKHQLTRPAGDFSTLPTSIRALVGDPRAFVRRLTNGSYEVYGGNAESIREVQEGGRVVAYEAWLSALVDRQDMALRWRYERIQGRLRLSALEDARGLRTQFFYTDNEPRWSDKARPWIEELLLAQSNLRFLNTSIRDPYGRVTNYEYQDLLTGLTLGEQPFAGDELLHSAIRDLSRHWQLIALRDVLDVRSQVRYLCSDSGTLATSVLGLNARLGSLRARGCLQGAGASLSFGAKAFYPKQTQTPYGTYEYTRIDEAFLHDGGQIPGDIDHYSAGTFLKRGWIVQNARGLAERTEAWFGDISPQAGSSIKSLVTRLSSPMPTVEQMLGARPAHIPPSDWRRLSGVARGYRTSIHWSYKATHDLERDGVVTPEAIRDPRATLPVSAGHIRQYLHDYAPGEESVSTSPLLVAEKTALEGWVFYGFQGTASDTFRNSSLQGETSAAASPSVVARQVVGGIQASYTEYTAQGLPRLIVDPVGRAQEIVYAPNGLEQTDIYAVRWNADATEDSRVRRLERLKHTEYNRHGQVTRLESADGETITFNYALSAPYPIESVTDELRRQTTRYTRQILNPTASLIDQIERYTVIDPNALEVSTDYYRGNLVRQESLGMTYRWTGHDAFDRPQYYLVNDQVRATYSYAGLNLQEILQADGMKVRVQVDNLGRPEWTWVLNGMDEVLRFSYREYDEGGGLRYFWDSRGQVMAWDYDIQGRPVAFTDTDRTQQQLTYEPLSSRVASSRDARGVESYLTYTLANELASKRFGLTTTTPSLSISYGRVYPRVESLTDSLGTTQYRYEEHLPYRLRELEQPLAGGSADAPNRLTLSLDYVAGRMTGWHAQDNLATRAQSFQTYHLDPQERVDQITSEIMSVYPNYAPFSAPEYGRVRNLGYDLKHESSGSRIDEVTQRFAYADAHDRRLQENRYQSILGGDVYNRVQYDQLQRIYRSEGLIDEGLQDYGYDELSQINSEKRSHFDSAGTMQIESNLGYEYDEVGNRKRINELDPRTSTPLSTLVSAEYGSGNQLQSYTTTRTRNAEYDAAGNMTYDPSNGYRYRYNDENRMSRIDYGKAGEYTLFTYDHNGHVCRIQEYEAGNITDDKTLVYVGEQLTQVRRTQNQTILRSINGDAYVDHSVTETGKPITQKYLMLRNHQNSVIGRMDQNGKVIERIDYNAWGVPQKRQLLTSSGHLIETPNLTSDMPLGYAGYLLHARSGLNLLKYRAYQPKQGRFIQKDPIGIAGGINLYAYVVNSPVGLIDDSGLIPRDPAKCIELTLQLALRNFSLADVATVEIMGYPPTGYRGAFEQLSSANVTRVARALTQPMPSQWWQRRPMTRLEYLQNLQRSAQHINSTNFARALRFACGDDDDNGPGNTTDGFSEEFAPWLRGRAQQAEQALQPGGYGLDYQQNWAELPDGTFVHFGDSARAPYVAGAVVAFIAAGLVWASGTGETAAAGAGILTTAAAAYAGLISWGTGLEQAARTLYQ